MKSLWKKVLAGILAAASALSLTVCTNSETLQAGGQSVSTGQQRVPATATAGGKILIA